VFRKRKKTVKPHNAPVTYARKNYNRSLVKEETENGPREGGNQRLCPQKKSYQEPVEGRKMDSLKYRTAVTSYESIKKKGNE